MLRCSFKPFSLRRALALLVVLVLSVGACVMPALADEGGYTIKEYHFEGVLHANNEMDVTESITANFSEPRHGIYRSIPTKFYVGGAFTGRGLQHYVCKVKNLSVSEQYSVESSENYEDIRIGDADVYVQNDHAYQLSYTYSMPDDRIAEKDLLYYSVLGAEWDTTIDHYSFNVTFEKPLSAEEVEGFKLYSGSYGLETNNLEVDYTVTESGVSGEVYNITPKQAITLFCPLKSGYFEKTRKQSPFLTGLFMLLTSIFAGLSIGVLIARRIRHWRRPVVTVEFYPPAGLSPAEVGVIIDNSTDDRDMMSLIPWWAQQGYLRIEDHNEGDKGVFDKKTDKNKAGLVLIKLKNLPNDAPEYQKKFYDTLFQGRERRDMNRINERFYEKYTDAKSKLTNHFTDERELVGGVISTFLLTAAISLTYIASLLFGSAISFCYDFWLLVWLVPIIIIYGLLARMGSAEEFSFFKLLLRSVGLVILLGISALLVELTLEDDMLLPKQVYWAGFWGVIGVQTISRWMTYSTEYRREMLGKLLGLKRFIKTAELPRLQMLLNENPEYYYDVLPYAIAFGLVDKWAKRFTELPQPEPRWYKSYDPHYHWNSMYLYDHLDRGFNQPIEHMGAEIAAAAASSSSSGGSSGGGGGGGGGGSW